MKIRLHKFLTLRWFDTELALGDLGTQITARKTFLMVHQRHLLSENSNRRHLFWALSRALGNKWEAVSGAANSGNQDEPWLVRD